MRRVAVVLVWLAAVAMVVVAVGMRVRARRLSDPAQAIASYVREVPPGFADIATIISRDPTSMQIEIRANQAWIRTFAQRNGFTPAEETLTGMAADRWTLLTSTGTILHLLLPLDGQPALLTVVTTD